MKVYLTFGNAFSLIFSPCVKHFFALLTVTTIFHVGSISKDGPSHLQADQERRTSLMVIANKAIRSDLYVGTEINPKINFAV